MLAANVRVLPRSLGKDDNRSISVFANLTRIIRHA